MHAKIMVGGRRARAGLGAGTVALALAVAALSTSTRADAVADEKAALDLKKAGYDTAKAGVDAELDAIKQLQSITGGTGDATAAESSAEGLLLSHYVYDGLSERLAAIVKANGPAGAPLVVFGSAAPTTADVVGFDEAVATLSRSLDRANTFWDQAVKAAAAAPVRPPKGTELMLQLFPPGPVGDVAAIASVADLFTVDTTYKGAAITVKDEQFDAQLANALAATGMAVDFDAFQVTGDPAYVRGKLAALDGAVETARHHYLQDYTPLLLKADGKTGSLDPNIAAAGKNLETVLGDYDAARKALFTPVNGLLPATTIERESRLRDHLTTRRILYIRNHKAAVTTDIRKGFFVGWFKPPVHLTVAAIVDYVMVDPNQSAVSASLGCASRRIYVMDVVTLNPGGNGSRKSVCTTDFVAVPRAQN